MAKSSSICFLLVLFYILASLTKSSATDQSNSINFIKTSCSRTKYPAICVRSLLGYANAIQTSPRQLALTALSVSLDRAQLTKTFVSRLAKFKGLKSREYAAIKDCIEEMNDSVNRLIKSVKELKNIGKYKGQEFLFHMSNAQTWISAAITDDNTCLDGFGGKALDGKIKTSLRARVVNLAQVTSNALALCNSFAGSY